MCGDTVPSEPGADLDQLRSFGGYFDLRVKSAPGQAQCAQSCLDGAVDLLFAQRRVSGWLAMANLDWRNPGEQELIGNGDHVIVAIGAVAFDTHFFTVHPFF